MEIDLLVNYPKTKRNTNERADVKTEESKYNFEWIFTTMMNLNNDNIYGTDFLIRRWFDLA